MKQNQWLKYLAAGLIGFISAGALAWHNIAFLWSGIKNRDQVHYAADAKLELLKLWIRAGGGSALERYLLDRGVERIAIYGYSDIGDLIYRCLKNTNIEVAYAIDSNGNNKESWLDVLTLQDELPTVDMVILAPVWKLGNVREVLEKKLSCEIVEMSQLVHYL